MKAQISQLQSRAVTALKPAIDWYQSRQANEQKVLQLLALVLALLMLVALVWMPAWETRAQQRNGWQAQEKLRTWISANEPAIRQVQASRDRKSTRLNSSHVKNSYAVFCLKKKKKILNRIHKIRSRYTQRDTNISIV